MKLPAGKGLQRPPSQRGAKAVRSLDPKAIQRVVTEAGCVLWSAQVTRADNGEILWDLRLVPSAAAREWLGCGDGEPNPDLWEACFHPEDVEGMQRRAREALEGGRPGYHQEFRMVGQDGRVRWLQETVAIHPKRKGEWELSGVAVDITDRKVAEEAMSASEMQFRAIWENSFEAIRLTDSEGRIVSANPAFYSLTGLSEEQVVGRPFNEVFTDPSMPPECALANYRRQFATGTLPQFFERAIRLVGGKEICVDVSVSYVQLDQQQFCLTVFRDSSDREEAARQLRRSEALFRSIWQHSHDAMRLTDDEGRILAVNPAYCELMETTEEDAVGTFFTECYKDRDIGGQILQEYRERWKGKRGALRIERRVELTSGRILYLNIGVSEIECPGSDTRMFLSVVHDITGMRQAEERRRTLERKMLEAQRLESLGVLSGGIAHDFNNLLTAILGNASLALLQLNHSSPIRLFIESIEKTSLQAADLCKQMLAYSGHGRIEFRNLDLNTLLREMNHLLQVSINKQIVLKFRLAPNLPCVEAEPSQIQQVVMNLAINASEAIGDRSGVITITTGTVRIDRSYWDKTLLTPEKPEGDYVYLEVSDTGCGMDERTRERIFDPFFTTKFTGRGLGMAAVLGIVQRHRGAFKVYSEVNEGTTVKILLPVSERESQTEDEVEVPRRKWKAQGTVLVADDEHSVRAVTARMLESFGLTVLLAKDGGDAIRVFNRYREEIDLVLLDMTMPEVSGEEAFRQIRQRNPEIPVLLMSGYTEADATMRFAGKKLSGFIQKPFQPGQLESKLRDLLEKTEG